MPSVLWFRRDLRLRDHPALCAAAADGEVLPLFVLDDSLLRAAGPRRVAFLAGALADLSRRTDGALRVLAGRPEQVVPAVVRRVGATSVHVSSDHGPYGRLRDASVTRALRDVPLVATGSPYGVTPGRLVKADGSSYQVFSAYHRAWLRHGLRAPAAPPALSWHDADLAGDPLPTRSVGGPLPEPTEAAAVQVWEQFASTALPDYAARRDTAQGTSRLSPYLKWGLLHPRTLHAALDDSESAQVFARELVWRDFYADVLWHQPGSARVDLRATGIDSDPPGARFEAWCAGRTGYPYVDAGMRQLAATGWLPNRVRMVVASFLTKDLHVHWSLGARHFMQHLVDADLASNQHNWQWVAGTGTDALPYHRVFNPVTQGRAHDPDGDYVRAWVPELAHVPGAAVHEPWALRDTRGYPSRIVDHAEERREALARARAARGSP